MEQPFKQEQDLSKYHTYGIAAKAKFFTEASSEKELSKAVAFAKEKNIPYLVIGRGSNMLFRNDYYPGLVILNKMTSYTITGTHVFAESGANLPLLCRKTAKSGLLGMEALVGVPGSVGGSIFMNAGVSGNEISKHLVSVRVLTDDGDIVTMKRDDCNFSYRKSIFHEIGGVILSAEFLLSVSEDAKKLVVEHLNKRVKSQPIEKKNSGCIFKNPDHEYSAGMLIDKCGLKGVKYGGAEVSTKHANFINNFDNATFEDVSKLINHVKKKVFEEMGVALDVEVWIV